MPHVWVKFFVRLAGLLAAGLVIGWLYDRPVIGLLIACAAGLAWQLMHLFRLYGWLHGNNPEFLPDGAGVWAQVFARINFIRNRSKRRSDRFRAMLKELRASARMFPDGGIILNARNEIVIYNRAARELLGLRKKRDRGQRIENLIRNPDFVAYLGAGNFATPVEIRLLAPVDCWLSCHLVPYGPDQRLLLLRNITAQREAADMRRDFVANASHELRTPLTVISGYLDTLADEPDLPPGLGQPLQEMRRQAERMQDLVSDLLHLAELESGEQRREDEPVMLGPLLETARQEAIATENCPATVEVVMESDLGLMGDKKQLQSVVSNLVANAVRHTPVDGEIRINWSADKKGGYLSVTDTGGGIAREHLSRITERFYRVQTGRDRSQGGGTGLGLAIVKHALLNHDAELEVESDYGHGSIFRCHFPVSRLVAAE